MHRLESINAFVVCSHPHEECHTHGLTTFTICESCGQVTEVYDLVMEERLKSFARARNVKGEKTTIEIRGQCAGRA